jgi:hypothetical protein
MSKGTSRELSLDGSIAGRAMETGDRQFRMTNRAVSWCRIHLESPENQSDKMEKVYNQKGISKFSSLAASYFSSLEPSIKFLKHYRQNLYFVKGYINLIQNNFQIVEISERKSQKR